MDVGNLQTGRRKVRIALIPLLGDQAFERRQGVVDRVQRQLGIGDVALHPAHRQVSVQGTTPATADAVAKHEFRGGLADQAVIDPTAIGDEAIDHPADAVFGHPFLVAGQ